MKVLLTHGYFIKEDPVEKQVMKPYPPMGLLYLSAYLEKQGVEHEVFDSTFAAFEELIGKIDSEKPEFIGIYVNFLTRNNVIKLIDHIRKSNFSASTKIIVGGPDVRYYAENYLENGADFVVVGEGEITFHEIISNGKNFAEIPGLIWKSEGQIIKNPERPLIRDLDSLPFPNRKKIDLQKYLDTWKKHHSYSSLTISTQRGCPYSCKWCSHAVFGDTYRRRSPVSVVEELAFLVKEYNPDSFWFVDDVFTMSEKWMMEFQEELKRKNVKISYECITRADKLSEKLIAVLKNTGCHTLWVGAESGSQRVIDLMDRRVDVKQVRKMIRMASEQGIKAGTFIMLGYPEETVEDIRETIHHLKESNPDIFTINKAYPIKGTKMYEDVCDSILDNPSWIAVPDRDVDFKRTYGKRFYDFAIRKVYNEVYSHKSLRNKNYPSYLKFKLKSLAASAGMYLFK